MSRLFLIGAVVAVVAIAAALFLINGGGDDAEAPVAADEAPAAEIAPAQQARAVDTANAAARFEEWAEPLRAVGLTVAGDRVVADGGGLTISGLDIAGPPDGLDWRWSAPSVRMAEAGDGGFTLEPEGAQSLSFIVNGAVVTALINSETLRIDVTKGVDGAIRTFNVVFVGLTMEADGGRPITAASGELRMTFAVTGGVADTEPISLRLDDLVLPGQSGGPLGATIRSINAALAFERSLADMAPGAALAAWLTGADGLILRNLVIEWGLLQLTGNGAIGIDEMGRPAGLFEVEIVEVLNVLDAFHAVLRFDRDLLADIYAAILEEMGANPDAPRLPFTIVIGDGRIILRGGARGIGDLVLGTVSPLFRAGG